MILVKEKAERIDEDIEIWQRLLTPKGLGSDERDFVEKRELFFELCNLNENTNQFLSRSLDEEDIHSLTNYFVTKFLGHEDINRWEELEKMRGHGHWAAIEKILQRSPQQLFMPRKKFTLIDYCRIVVWKFEK